MNPREMLAAPLLAGLAAWRALSGYRPPPGAFRILLLHDVPPAHYDALARLLDRIAAEGGFLTPDAAIARLAGDDGGDGCVPWLVSFDDGFACNRAVAEALLAPRGIRAVFFVCPGLIDLAPAARREAVMRQVLQGRAGSGAPLSGQVLMGWDDLAALARAGHAIGGHSLSHRRLAGLGAAALEDEVAGAAERIARNLGGAADWFAYPFGDIGSIDEDALGAVGRHWRICRSGVRGLNLPGAHRLALLADHVDLAATAAWRHLVLAGGLDSRYAAARARLAAMAGSSGHQPAP